MASPNDKNDRSAGRSADRSDDRKLQTEAALARRLAEAFDKIGPAAAGDCPDPEQLAAYQERTLSPEESARCESHLAACSRCRKILTILAAGSDAPLADTEVAHLGELAAAKQPSVSQGTAPVSIARPKALPPASRRPRWLVPALAAAAVLVLALLVRPLWRAHTTSQTQVAQTTQAPAPNAVAPDSSSPGTTPPPAALSGLPPAEPTLPPVNPAAPEAVPKQSPPNKADAQVDDLIRSAADNGTVSLDRTDSAAKRREAPVAPAGAAAAQAQTQSAPNAPAPVPRAAPAAPVPPPAPRAAPAAGGVAGLYSGADRLATGGAGVVLRVRSSQVAWRASGGGRIERSTDGGRTWQAQQSPSRDDWLAGVAVSDTICWLVGRNGAVARTADGQTWEPLAAPSVEDSSGKRPDWVAIAASDADNATLTSADQQRYITHDGGRTWEKQ